MQALRSGRDGSLWIGTDGKGVARFREGLFAAEPALAADSGNSLYVDEAGRLWIATWMGLVVVEGGQVRRIDTSSGLPHNAVFSVAGDGKGRVWAATSVGLVELRDGRPLRLPAYARIREPQSLLVDSRGALWVGAASGLYRVEGERIVSFSTEDGLLANFVTALAQDRDGSIWIGTEGGLNRWRDGRFDAAGFEPLSGSAVASLLEDREGNLWIGLRGTGLVRLQEGRPHHLVARGRPLREQRHLHVPVLGRQPVVRDDARPDASARRALQRLHEARRPAQRLDHRPRRAPGARPADRDLRQAPQHLPRRAYRRAAAAGDRPRRCPR